MEIRKYMGRIYLRIQSFKIPLKIGELRGTLHEIVVAVDTLEIFRELHSYVSRVNSKRHHPPGQPLGV